jgi:hypothetical protein
MAVDSLKLVDFVGSDGKYIPGLVPLRAAAEASFRIDERAAVLYAETFKDLDYVFFRRFTDGRSSQILAYVVDNSDERLNEKALAELHLKLWLHGAAPLLYIAWPGRIDILTCAAGPVFWRDEECHYTPVDTIKAASEITGELGRFSALRLADGTFWEDPTNGGLAGHSRSAHQMLIQAVVETDNDLQGGERPILRRLLLLTVLVKYLEDRRVFPDGWFGEFHKGARNFFQVLQGGDPEEVYRLLDSLERKFNGDVFSIPVQERRVLTRDSLIRFANLVEAKTIGRQRCLWEQYSFEHIPVEIISNIYQRFVEGGHGAVYTPPFLASLLLDHVMPYERLTGKERVLDPACGSGVFLVGAFRRLINVWRHQNDWKRPDVSTLKGILRQSICGIEVDGNAVNLTAFSMCLAICDALQPDVIWKDLRFDVLRGENLVEADFFSVLRDFQQGRPTIMGGGFDVVVGNPPFESRLSADGMAVDRAARRQDSSRGALPDRQAAYLFLEQSLTALRGDGRVCLIQPYGLIHGRNSRTFFNTIHRKHRVDAILDFTSIRKLYDKADTKTIAVVAQSGRCSDDYSINHLTFRRTVSVKERICFELDHYDRHRVSQKVAEESPSVWRSNILGGGRLFDMSRRLQSMRTLAQYIEWKGWDYGEGCLVAKTGKRTKAPFLTGKPYLPTKAFTDNGVDKSKIDIVRETHFRSAYTESRYSPPLVLIRKVDSLPIVFWEDHFIVYRHQIIGIHAPQSERSELRELYNTIRHNHDVYRFSCTLNATHLLVGKATSILKQDMDALPYPEDTNNLSLSFWEKALCEDVLTYMTEYVRLGQNSELLARAANTDDLREYSSMFIRMLRSIYDNLQASDPVFLDGLTCQAFYFGERPSLSWITEQPQDELRKLIYDDEKRGLLRTIRVLRLYSGNLLLIVKPDRLRYWIRSTAIRDADETIVDLRRQGY